MELTDSVLMALDSSLNENSSQAQVASRSLAARIAKVEGLKTFPVVAKRVMGILQHSEFRVKEASRAIKEDPSLAAGVVRLSNTAFFYRGNPVVSIDGAIVRLGRDSVRNVVTAVATMGMFPDILGIGKAVRDHCSAVAAIAHVLAKKFSPENTEGIFLCGLLHDVGKMLLIESAEIICGSTGVSKTTKPDSDHLKERDTLGFDHAVLAGQVLWQWQLADPIPQIVAWHHQPGLAYKTESIGPTIALLRIADSIDYCLQESPDESDELLDDLAAREDCAYLKVRAEDLRINWSGFVEARNEALALFGT